MKLVELTCELDLSSALLPRRLEGDPVRSVGLHLTDIIRDIMEASGIQKTTSGTSWLPDKLDMAAEVGFLWEDVLSAALKDRLPCRIGEIVIDGIAMSPDGLEMENGELILAEYKCAWRSSKNLPTESFKWMAQVKAYCHGVGTNTVKMYILHLNGDWRPPQPQYRGYKIEFTDLELQENWEMITNHARNRGWIK